MSKSTLPALLLIAILPMLACQLLRPVRASCRVDLPGVGWIQHWDGDEIAFKVDGMDWTATVDCKAGQLVNGQPVRPVRAREVLIPVEDTYYRLITSDPDISMFEFRDNGSHVRINVNGGYYVAVLSIWPGSFDRAIVRYFMGGQNEDGLMHLHCYDHTKGQAGTSLHLLASMWTLSEPVTVSLVCSGRNFILEMSTELTAEILGLGPTLAPATPVPTMTPAPPGFDTGLRTGS